MKDMVSVVIPCRNEEKYIEKCLSSLLLQDHENYEVIVADGLSEDRSAKIISGIAAQHPNIYLHKNPKKSSASGLNVGIRNASGEVIIILGAHTEVTSDFISKNLHYLKNTGADVVGGVLNTVGEGYLGESISFTLSSPFGTGSKFRYSNSAQYVDTVPFGAYRAAVFNKVGLFNEDIPRSEDLDLNHRIMNAGGKIYMDPEIKTTYYCRNSWFDFIKQNYGNGKDVILAFIKDQSSVSIRHLLPFCFILSFLILLSGSLFSSIARKLFILEAIIYLLAILIISVKLSMKNGIKYFPILPAVFAALHFSYGIGSLCAFHKHMVVRAMKIFQGAGRVFIL